MEDSLSTLFRLLCHSRTRPEATAPLTFNRGRFTPGTRFAIRPRCPQKPDSATGGWECTGAGFRSNVGHPGKRKRATRVGVALSPRPPRFTRGEWKTIPERFPGKSAWRSCTCKFRYCSPFRRKPARCSSKRLAGMFRTNGGKRFSNPSRGKRCTMATP